MTNVIEILTENGPLLSSELIIYLAKTYSLSKEAARKQLSRSKFPVLKLSGFFARNQSLFYLQEHIQDKSFIAILKDKLKDSARRVFTLIKALEFHHGYLLTDQLPAYMFSPVKNLKGHKRVDVVLKDALETDLLKQDENYVRLNQSYFQAWQIDLRQYKALEIARNFILSQFIDWSRKIGIVSYDKPTLYSEFSKFLWAFTAPSYVGNLTTYKNGGLMPAFIIADILIGREVTEDDVIFYIEKVKVLKAMKGASKLIPFLLVDSLTVEAMTKLKQQGIVVGFIDKLFGNGYTELIRTLINTVSNAGAILKKNPNEFLALMDKIGKLVDGKTNNLRGDVFELAVGYYHSRFCKNLDVGKVIYIDGLQMELDVFAVYADQVKVCECKALKRPITIDEIDAWLNKIPDIRGWIESQEAYNHKRHVFEFWSTGGFEEEALGKLDRVSKVKKYNILFFDEAAIVRNARQLPGTKFMNILNQYFIKEPV